MDVHGCVAKGPRWVNKSMPGTPRRAIIVAQCFRWYVKCQQRQPSWLALRCCACPAWPGRVCGISAGGRARTLTPRTARSVVGLSVRQANCAFCRRCRRRRRTITAQRPVSGDAPLPLNLLPKSKPVWYAADTQAILVIRAWKRSNCYPSLSRGLSRNSSSCIAPVRQRWLAPPVDVHVGGCRTRRVGDEVAMTYIHRD